MNEPLTWVAIRREALALEITALESDGHVFLHQCGSGKSRQVWGRPGWVRGSGSVASGGTPRHRDTRSIA
jgi:hypothetical protein